MDPFQGMHSMVHHPHASAMAVHGHGPGSAYMIMPMDTRDPTPQIDRDSPETSSSTTQRDGDRQQTPFASQSIPLVCCICPKSSAFSDVSHLLTHVASKGHLAKKFNCELAASESETARQTLQEFDIWFEKYNIGKLLQNRKQNRNERVTKNRGRGGTNAATTNNCRGKAGNATRGSSSRGKKRGREGATPAIPIVKYEEARGDDLGSFSGLQTLSKKRRNDALGASSEGVNSLSLFNNAYYEPTMQQGFAMPGAGDDGEPVVKYENSDSCENENDGSSEEDRPANNVDLANQSPIIYPNTGVWKDYNIEDLELTEEEELDRQNFRKYLKGDILKLPGVGGFDSASDEQKRMRNQKKDPSVMHQMEAESRLVTTVEEVTDMQFNHMRSGDVYDEPSIDGDADDGDEEDMELARKLKRRSPRTRAQAAKSRGDANSGDSANLESISHASKGHASRGSRRGAGRATRSRAAPDLIPESPSANLHDPIRDPVHESVLDVVAAPPLARFNHPTLQSPSPFSLGGFGNPALDVFNGSPEGSRGGEGWTDQRFYTPAQDTLPGLSLRPGNSNVPLQSPTTRLKRHENSHHNFGGKENNHLSFEPSQATSNPYLNTQDSLNVNSVNPLCVPGRGNDFRGFSSYEDAKPLTTGFQPINGHAGYNGLQMARRDDSKGYQSQHHRNVYGI